MASKRIGRSVKKINNMKKVIDLIKKFLFGSKIEKAVAAAQVVKEVKKVAPKAAPKKKK
jgi:predicted RNA-binding protein YlxR (DUF448 family)